MELSDQAKAARREYTKKYARAYREKNRDRIREYKRAWDKAHPGKEQEYQRTFWERKAREMADQEQ